MGSPPFRTFPPHTWTEQITLARKFVPLFLIDGNHKADPAVLGEGGAVPRLLAKESRLLS